MGQQGAASSQSDRITPAAGRHISQIDGLRALAILMVFVHHAFAIPQLWAGVDLFFILSGFLITGILIRDTAPAPGGKPRFSFPQLARRFYTRRAQRILPAYCLFMLAAVPLIPIAWHRLWPWYAFFGQNIPVAFAWISPNALAPLWSLGVENQFYLVWPLLVFFLPRRWLAPGMIALLIGEPILRFFASPHFADGAVLYALTPFRLDTLAAGALFALTLPGIAPARAPKMRRMAQIVMAVAMLVLGALTVHYPWFRRAYNAPSYNSLIYTFNLVILGAVFVWAWFSTGLFTRILSSRLLAGLGRISYMFYLSHLFFLYWAIDRMKGHSHAKLLAPVLAFAVTVAFSTLSWAAVEKPILNLGRKRKPGRQEVANSQAAA
jgi:peptidoglycan/LPS O-acetylase OafA/YrhL